MRSQATVSVIIPALNEEASVGRVIEAIPGWVDDIIVVDNGSTDRTAEVARARGARIITEPVRGYGSACLAGIAAVSNPVVVVFLDADYSDYPEEMALLADPIARDEADMVIGSRTLGRREAGALTPQARFGNWLACMLIRLFWSVSYSDLGPFRAVRSTTLNRLRMSDPDYGWTVEMQIKAAQKGVRIKEVPVSYRRRIGKSKISGTIRGVIGAGTKILLTIFRALAGSLPGAEDRASGERLIVFTRYPEPGKTKTRLIPVLGPHGAAELHRLMSEQAIEQARRLSEERPLALEVLYEGGGRRLMRQWLGPGISYRRQCDGDIGKRMAHAFREAFRKASGPAVIVGTDCPARTAGYMKEAFEKLNSHDLVLGPASDGGYHLIGLRREIPQFFTNMPWSTEQVTSRTLQVADALGLSAALLEPLDDVDTPEDLHVWEREERRSASRSGIESISVIIPTLNEAANIAAAIESARSGPGSEVIVVDGGSSDDTVRIAESLGVKVLRTSPRRATQMNAGAALAKGDALLFLHADGRLPAGFEDHVREALTRPGFSAGAFVLRIDSPSRTLRLIERLANWRSRYLQMPYGDQAFFLRARIFHQMGGFPDNPIMEDFELVRRLKRRGRILIVSAPAVTSARRWSRLGAWRTTLINQGAVMAYYAGVPLTAIARWYNRDRKRR